MRHLRSSHVYSTGHWSWDTSHFGWESRTCIWWVIWHEHLSWSWECEVEKLSAYLKQMGHQFLMLIPQLMHAAIGAKHLWGHGTYVNLVDNPVQYMMGDMEWAFKLKLRVWGWEVKWVSQANRASAFKANSLAYTPIIVEHVPGHGTHVNGV